MNTNPVTIDSAESLRQHIEKEIFLAPTEELQKHLPNATKCGETNRKWSVQAMWHDHLNLATHIKSLAEMELEWRISPDCAELRPSLI